MARVTVEEQAPGKQPLDGEQLQIKLKRLAEEIASDLSSVGPALSKELLGGFVSDLFLVVAEQRRRAERRQKQAEGIAAAKAKGVHFGRPAKPLPEGFDEIHQAWRDGRISLQQAADACGIARGTFYNIAMRREQTENCSV